MYICIPILTGGREHPNVQCGLVIVTAEVLWGFEFSGWNIPDFKLFQLVPSFNHNVIMFNDSVSLTQL